MPDGPTFTLNGEKIARGQARDLRLTISESYVGNPVDLPVHVLRAPKRGPVLAVIAAIHGNEINGTGIIQELMYEQPLTLTAGTLVLVPVINAFGFEEQSRYLPDRRDLNRSFPGSAAGSLAARVAHCVFTRIVRHADAVIDLHSAALGRVNFPNVRADLSNKQVRALANAFGCELVVNGKGPEGSLRREACKAGIPTIILEAGEPSKIEPSVLAIGVRGVRNVLVELGMIDGERQPPVYQTRVDRTAWVRSEVGGILRFHVAPGAIVERGQPIATSTKVFSRQRATLVSPVEGIVLGMTTLPVVKPGEPVCHVAIPRKSIASIRAALTGLPGRGRRVARRVRRDLATSVYVTEPEQDVEPRPAESSDAAPPPTEDEPR